MGRGSKGSGGPVADWVSRAADETIAFAAAEAERVGEPDRVITCASGASPSGPVHLGNLREFLTVHFVADEIARRGLPVRHLHSWDDFDRFRKVPKGVDPSWAEHIGKPLTAVPDPDGQYPSWAERFKAPLMDSLAELGVEMEVVSQTEAYRRGDYRENILTAVRQRDAIEQTLAKYRTKAAPEAETDSAEEAEALADSVAADDEPSGTSDLARFPYRPYCRDCGRDTVDLLSYDDETTDLSYRCTVCDFEGTTNLTTQNEGKLVWKVDWPMRWTVEGVDFEPGGLDHSTPGSSYTVGKELVKRIYGGRAPRFVSYAFVGTGGQVKMSSSAGGVPTASDALRVLEAPLLRWLYVRRAPKQAFNIELGSDLVRAYDEWDALTRKAGDPDKRDAQVLAHERARRTESAGDLPTPEVVAPFRLLGSVADVTAGDPEQVGRIVGQVGYPHESLDQLEPRLSRATTWRHDFVPADERTIVRESADDDRLASLEASESRWLDLLAEALPDPLTLEETTSVIYGVPKLARDLGVDEDPTDEVKADQKAFFRLLYNLLVDADRGPRLPTLFMALGRERVLSLLGRS